MIRPRISTRSAAESSRRAVEPLEGRILFAAGNLDPSFGTGGVLDVPREVFTGLVAAIDVQPDGKIVAAGSYGTSDPNVKTAAVARFNADGTLDRGFGGDGVVELPGAANLSRLGDVEVLPNGDIVAVGAGGWASFGVRGLLAARLHPDGSLDASFGAGGVAKVSLDDPSLQRTLHLGVAIDVAPGGEVFVAGQVDLDATPSVVDPVLSRPAVVKLTRAGELDRSFGDADNPGMWTLPGGEAGYSPFNPTRLARDVSALPDGRVVVAGDVEDSGNQPNVFVARLTTAGAPDPSFSGDGILRFDYTADPADVGTANALAVQPDGRVIVAGASSLNGDDHRGVRVARLTTDGRLDSSFGAGGIRPFAFGGPGVMAEEVKLQADGKIVVGGVGTRFFRPGFGVARLTPNGAMDPTFGQSGRTFTPLKVQFDPNNDWRVTDMDLAPDGKVVMDGNRALPDNHFDHSTPVFARYLGDTPVPPPPPLPPTNTWIVQGEDTERASGTVVGRSHVGYTGTGYLDFVGNSGASADWIIEETPGAGIYTIQFRYANGSPSARQMAFDAFPAHSPMQLSFAPTGSWSTWRTLTIDATMLQGSPALPMSLITTGQNGPNIDKITVSYQPLPSEDQNYQAENATLVGARVASNHVGYTGTGFADFTNARGDSITWNVFPHEGGRHLLIFRYANGGLSDRALQLSVNGDVLNSLSFAPTGSWSTWGEVSLEWNLLDVGNEVKISTVGNNGPNVDVLTVRPLRD